MTKNIVNAKLYLVPGNGLIQGKLSKDDSVTGNPEIARRYTQHVA
jgi:hypothetical protein